jgi:LysM repeat protein
VRKRTWSHYAAPAAFLVAVTIAVLAVRSALDTGPASTSATTLPPTPTRSAVTTTRRATTTRRRAAPRVYVVVAGDTFEVISTKTGVPVARIAQLNPDADSNALFIGQRLRLR